MYKWLCHQACPVQSCWLQPTKCPCNGEKYPRWPLRIALLPLPSPGLPLCTAPVRGAALCCPMPYLSTPLHHCECPFLLWNCSARSTSHMAGWELLGTLTCFQVASNSPNSPVPFFRAILLSSKVIEYKRHCIDRWLSLLFNSFLLTELFFVLVVGDLLIGCFSFSRHLRFMAIHGHLSVLQDPCHHLWLWLSSLLLFSSFHSSYFYPYLLMIHHHSIRIFLAF